ncbi:MAG TPA: adenylate kinase [Ruminiclostridium sp.]|jgi:adenylate kinase|nr:adenylate kinase [Clostridiaceae bacterium]HAA25412.1 adenylate kinase [Ruminiclostridium sp.]
MRIVLLGAPGAGKGTQAGILSKRLNIPHISTGDIFRANIQKGTELGLKAKEFIDRGKLVPDDLTVSIVKDRLLKDDCQRGFILDGFPRTIPQAESLDNELSGLGIKLDAVINLEVPDEVIVRRMQGRRVCARCGKPYHVLTLKPKQEGICDVCGGPLIVRDDDKEETVRERLRVYYKNTEPLTGYYESKGILYNFDGTKDIEVTTGEIMSKLEQITGKTG